MPLQAGNVNRVLISKAAAAQISCVCLVLVCSFEGNSFTGHRPQTELSVGAVFHKLLKETDELDQNFEMYLTCTETLF